MVNWAFYPFLHPHKDSPEEKLNLVINKATLIRTLSLRNYSPIIPYNAFLTKVQRLNMQWTRSTYICLYFILFQLYCTNFWILQKWSQTNDKSCQLISVINSLGCCKYLKVKLWFCSCLCWCLLIIQLFLITIWNYKQLKLTNRLSSEKEPKNHKQ